MGKGEPASTGTQVLPLSSATDRMIQYRYNTVR